MQRERKGEKSRREKGQRRDGRMGQKNVKKEKIVIAGC